MALVERIRCPLCGTPRTSRTYLEEYGLSKSLNDIGGRGHSVWQHNIPLSREEALFFRKRVSDILAAIDQALGPESTGG